MNIAGKIAHRYSNKIVNFTMGENSNSKEFEEALEYILKRIFTQLIIIVFIMLTALPFKLMKEMIIYYIIFLTFRSCFGGYHAKNDKICLILSIVIPILVCIIIKMVDFSLLAIIIIYLIAAIIGIKCGTFVHPNRPLGNSPKVTRKRTRRLKIIGLSVLSFLFIIHLVFLKGNMSDAVVMSVFIAIGNRIFAR